MKKKYFVISLSVLLLSGCTKEMESLLPPVPGIKNMFVKSKSADQQIKESQDKLLTKSFIDKKIDKVTSIEQEQVGIKIEKNRLYQTDSYIYYSKSKNFYRNLAQEFLEDEVAKIYINAIKSRVNGYIIYNGNGNKMILGALVGGEKNLKMRDEFGIYVYDSDFAIIEYDSEGNKVSALVRQANIEPSSLGMTMGDKDPAVTIHQRIYIVFKQQINKIDLSLDKNRLDNSEYKRFNMPQIENNLKPISNQQPVSTKSNTEEIKELYELYKAGALTKEEFDLEKKKVLEKSNKNDRATPTSENSKSVQNPFELMIVQKFNEEHGTSFITMKEVQDYIQSKQN